MKTWPFRNDHYFKNNLIAQILCLANRMDYNFTYMSKNSWSFNIELGIIPIGSLFQNEEYRKYKE